ncbi:HPr family phosphocarrier protein [Ectothiorhodospiraceae bacterium BW-2]|nr:HPr family phosphocarrier protein [Ectothiorhodospiraceae bacterium BW-2]
MVEQPLQLSNRLGLHARAAAKLATTAQKYQAEIELHYLNRAVNAKSIMAIMMLGATFGSDIVLKALGEDEQQAVEALSELIKRRFDEPE